MESGGGRGRNLFANGLGASLPWKRQASSVDFEGWAACDRDYGPFAPRWARSHHAIDFLERLTS